MLDGGHNPECAAALRNVLVRFAGDKSITVLIGMMADKDTKDYLAAILPHCKTAVFTKPSNPRAEDENVLLREGECFCRDVVSVKDPKDAYKKARSLVKNGDMLLVCGSFYLLSVHFRRALKNLTYLCSFDTIFIRVILNLTAAYLFAVRFINLKGYGELVWLSRKPY